MYQGGLLRLLYSEVAAVLVTLAWIGFPSWSNLGRTGVDRFEFRGWPLTKTA
jgi:hypothetical protein